MRLVKRSALALIIIASLAGGSPAFAAEEPPLVTALLKTWESRLSVKPTYQSLTTESDGSVVIEGLSAAAPMQSDPTLKSSLSVAKIKLSGITDKGNGLFEVASTQLSDAKIDVSSPEGGVVVSVPQISAESLYVKVLGENPTPDDIKRASMYLAKKTSVGAMTLTAAGQTLSVDSYEMTWDGDPVTGSGKTDFKISNIAIPEAAVASLDQQGMLKELGYSSLSFDIGGNADTDIGPDKMRFDFDAFYAGKDIGTLKVGAGIAEIPLTLMTELQNLASGVQRDTSVFMSLVGGIQLSRVTIRFEDQSLTRKLIALLARTQNKDEAAILADAGTDLQRDLAMYNNPAFAEKAAEAIMAFLKDPRSITILAKPAQPITVQQLIELNDPGKVIDQFGVTISAND